MLKLRKNKKGFTLVELIVVIAIMAVLAGVVAGVTVSQLNKQTNKTGSTQAKTIADYISTVTLTGENEEGELKLLDADGAFSSTALQGLITAQYSAASIKVVYSENKPDSFTPGQIAVYLENDGDVHVKYTRKGTTGDQAEYKVATTGVVSKV